MGSKKMSLRDEPLHVMRVYQDDWEKIFDELIRRAKASKSYGIHADVLHDWLIELEGLRENEMKLRFKE